MDKKQDVAKREATNLPLILMEKERFQKKLCQNEDGRIRKGLGDSERRNKSQVQHLTSDRELGMSAERKEISSG